MTPRSTQPMQPRNPSGDVGMYQNPTQAALGSMQGAMTPMSGGGPGEERTMYPMQAMGPAPSQPWVPPANSSVVGGRTGGVDPNMQGGFRPPTHGDPYLGPKVWGDPAMRGPMLANLLRRG